MAGGKVDGAGEGIPVVGGGGGDCLAPPRIGPSERVLLGRCGTAFRLSVATEGFSARVPGVLNLEDLAWADVRPESREMPGSMGLMPPGLKDSLLSPWANRGI